MSAESGDLDSALDQLEQLATEKHAAMLRHDWRALEETVEQMDRLAAVLGQQLEACPPAAKERLLRLRSATDRNARLARGLGAQLTRLAQASRPSGLYTRGARLRRDQPALMRCIG
jgi:DNA mismatch repair protein MutH